MDSPTVTDVLMSLVDMAPIILAVAFVVFAGFGIAFCIRGSGACSFLTRDGGQEHGNMP